MPFAALSYGVATGHDQRIAEIFAEQNFRRVDSPVMEDEAGDIVGFLVATGLFLEGGTVVRVIQHDGGTVHDIARHMSVQEGVHEAERAILPYLSQPRDTETPAGFVRHFFDSLLLELDQQAVSDEPAAGIVALRYPIGDCSIEQLRAAHSAWRRGPGVEPGVDGVVRTALFVRPGDFVLRAIQHRGDEEQVLLAIAGAHGGAGPDPWLDGMLADGVASTADVAPMRPVSFLSAATSE